MLNKYIFVVSVVWTSFEGDDNVFTVPNFKSINQFSQVIFSAQEAYEKKGTQGAVRTK